MSYPSDQAMILQTLEIIVKTIIDIWTTELIYKSLSTIPRKLPIELQKQLMTKVIQLANDVHIESNSGMK